MSCFDKRIENIAKAHAHDIINEVKNQSPVVGKDCIDLHKWEEKTRDLLDDLEEKFESNLLNEVKMDYEIKYNDDYANKFHSTKEEEFEEFLQKTKIPVTKEWAKRTFKHFINQKYNIIEIYRSKFKAGDIMENMLASDVFLEIAKNYIEKRFGCYIVDYYEDQHSPYDDLASGPDPFKDENDEEIFYVDPFEDRDEDTVIYLNINDLNDENDYNQNEEGC